MAASFVRFALVQINPTVGDIAGNAALAAEGLDAARERGASFAIFPEMTVTGYPPEDLLFKKHFIAAQRKAVQTLAARTRGLAAAIGFVDRGPDGRLYNAAAIYSNGRLAGVYRKMSLPNYGVFDEKRYFSAGETPLVLDFGRGRAAVSICEDLWPQGEAYQKALGKGPVDVLINLSASPYHFKKGAVREKLMKNHATRLKTHVLYCNLVGGQDELVFDGTSLAYAPSGRQLLKARRFADHIAVVDVPLDGAGVEKPLPPGLKVLKMAVPMKSGKPAAPDRFKPEPQDDVAEVYQALVLGVKDYVRKNGFKTVALGISGGIDSALVLAVACDAIGASNVCAVSMPSGYSSLATREDAKKCALNFGARFSELSIEKLRNAFLDALQPAFAGTKPGAAEENIQARIRGNFLMALSNKFGHLILTTGNKSELATGYCTLYGDMAGGFAVLKDVPKTLVYKLCKYRNALAGGDVIPDTVIKRPPTAELRPNQKDTDSLPPYDTLDPIVERYVERDWSAEEIVADGFDHALVHGVIRRIDGNEYKRRQGPIGVKITPRAFGRDRRVPITNSFLEKS